MEILKSSDRGHFNHGWLKTWHTFSFSEYYNPKRMGFRTLRVINQDIVEPGRGFETHGHRDMEIISYVLRGALEHKDSLGTGSVIRPGEIQYMSAGSGVTHSEFNHSKTEEVELLQIWILPRERGLEPRYDQRPIEIDDRLALIASGQEHPLAIRIAQDADIYAAKAQAGTTLTFNPKFGNLWIQVARGSLTILGRELGSGDGAALNATRELSIISGSVGCEVIVFDLV